MLILGKDASYENIETRLSFRKFENFLMVEETNERWFEIASARAKNEKEKLHLWWPQQIHYLW